MPCCSCSALKLADAAMKPPTQGMLPSAATTKRTYFRPLPSVSLATRAFWEASTSLAVSLWTGLSLILPPNSGILTRAKQRRILWLPGWTGPPGPRRQMAQRYLFRGVSILDLIEDRKHKLKAAFSHLPQVPADELSLEIKLANDFRLDVPVLDESKKYAKT